MYRCPPDLRLTPLPIERRWSCSAAVSSTHHSLFAPTITPLSSHHGALLSRQASFFIFSTLWEVRKSLTHWQDKVRYHHKDS